MVEPWKYSPCLLLKTTAVDKEGWPLEKCAFRFLQVVLHLCLFWWVIDCCELTKLLKLQSESYKVYDKVRKKREKEIKDKFNRCRAWWVVGWFLLLLALWLISPSSMAWQLVFLGAAALRLFEILITGIGTILAQEQQIGARNLTTLTLYFFHTVLIFAIFYHCVPGADFTIDLGPKHLPSASSPGDYLYASLAYVTSLEGNYKAKGNVSEFLTVFTTTFSLFLFTVLIAFGIDESRKRATKEKTR